MSSPAGKMTRYEDLSSDQQKVVDVWGQGFAVMAGAGSGKTTTLTVKVEKLLELQPDARFCAVSFTEKSASDLKLKLETRLAHRQKTLRGEGGVLSGHWVMTIHGLCGAIVREFPAEAGIDGFEPILSEAQSQLLWERALDRLWREDLAPEIREEMERLLERTKRQGLHSLLGRVKSLRNQGALSALLAYSDDDAVGRDSLALGRVAERVIQYYETSKARRGALDFDDLERLAARVLENPVARQTLQQRFDFLMVDEFQDTSPLQGQIVWSLAKPDQRNLCVIGDPKQSIYRFRDADVSVFEEFCARLSDTLTLKENYRSRPDIIHFTNQVCDPLFQASDLKYEPLIPQKSAGDPHQTGVKVLRISDPRELADWLRQEQATHGLGLEKFVILLRKVRSPSAGRWLDALSLQGIPLAIGSGGRFWDDPRVAELVCFLKWWNNPANRLSAATFLRAPWVWERLGISEVELDLWLQEGSEALLLDRFLRLPDCPFSARLRALRDNPRGLTPGALLWAFLEDEAVEREMGISVLALWHRAEQFSREGLSFHEVVEELARGLEESPRETEVPPPLNEGQLRVLTIHASKGLEFEHVLLLDFPPKAERTPSSPALYWDRKKGVFLPPVTPPGVSKKLTAEDPETEWKKHENAAALAEVKRVFYVALTRAQERLVCVFAGEDLPPSEKKKTGPALGPDHQDHWRAWVQSFAQGGGETFFEEQEFTRGPREKGEAASPLVAHLISPPSRSAQSQTSASPEFFRPRHSVTEWMTLMRCPRQYEWSFIRPRTPAGEDQAVGVESALGTRPGPSAKQGRGSLTAAEIGTRVHHAIELGESESLHELEREVGSARFRAAPVVDWIQRSLSLRETSVVQTWSELPFEIQVSPPGEEPELLVGTLDGLHALRSAEGSEELQYQIVDYKVLRKGKSPEELLTTYRAQLHLYAWAIGSLEPSTLTRRSASLIAFSPDQGAQEVLCALPSQDELNEWVGRLLTASKEVIREGGRPQPGSACRHCAFRVQCDASDFKSVSAIDLTEDSEF